MTTLTIDTHDFFTQLKQAGVPEQQAEIITRLHQQAANATIEYVKHEHGLDKLVTTKELDARIKETELKIELVKADLKRDIAESKDDLRKWMTTVVFGTAILQTAIIAALVLKLAGHI